MKPPLHPGRRDLVGTHCKLLYASSKDTSATVAPFVQILRGGPVGAPRTIRTALGPEAGWEDTGNGREQPYCLQTTCKRARARRTAPFLLGEGWASATGVHG